MLRTFLASSRSLHDRSRQVIHTTSRHASDVSMAYIAGFRCADCPFEMQMGESFAGASLLTDIDERKRAEDALKRSEAFLAEGQRLSRIGSCFLACGNRRNHVVRGTLSHFWV